MSIIYRINMSDLSVAVEQLSERHAQLGGRGLTSTLIAEEVPPTCHPLSAENKLVLAPGILTGTGAPCAGRLVGRRQESVDRDDQGGELRRHGGVGSGGLGDSRAGD